MNHPPHVTRIVLMQDVALHPNWHAGNLYGTSYSDRVQALCVVAKRLSIEVALHGEWACAPQAEHLTPVATSFDARPARPGDLWIYVEPAPPPPQVYLPPSAKRSG